MGKYVFNSVEDFLTDDDYIRFVFEQSPLLVKRWDEYLKNDHPELIHLAEEARQILLDGLDMPNLQPDENNELKERIMKTVSDLNH